MDADHTYFWQLFGWSAVVAFVLFFITWIISLRLNNFSFVDITWSYCLTFIVLLYGIAGDGLWERRLMAMIVATVWSFRLGTHLLLRIIKHHPEEDVRYSMLRKNWQERLAFSFFLFFQSQAVSMVLLGVPFLVICLNKATPINLLEWIGIGVSLIGVAGEALSDAQMRRFKHDPANKGKVCQDGLWSVSRHPNYFFEFIVWLGFWLFASGSPWGWVTIYAPAMILYLLLRVTGIPLTEKMSVQSKGDLYRDYQRSTSAFIPWFRKTPPSK